MMRFVFCPVFLVFSAGCGGSAFSSALTDPLGDADPPVEAASDAGPDSPIVHDSGPIEASSDVQTDAACPCGSDLNGAGDFSISFRIVTSDNASAVPILNQRTLCDAAESFWEVGMGGGQLEIQVATPYSSINSTAHIADGLEHHVAIVRRSGEISFAVDDIGAGSGQAAAPLKNLPALQIGAEPACGTTAPLVGSVTNVCLKTCGF